MSTERTTQSKSLQNDEDGPVINGELREDERAYLAKLNQVADAEG